MVRVSKDGNAVSLTAVPDRVQFFLVCILHRVVSVLDSGAV